MDQNVAFFKKKKKMTNMLRVNQLQERSLCSVPSMCCDALQKLFLESSTINRLPKGKWMQHLHALKYSPVALGATWVRGEKKITFFPLLEQEKKYIFLLCVALVGESLCHLQLASDISIWCRGNVFSSKLITDLYRSRSLNMSWLLFLSSWSTSS